MKPDNVVGGVELDKEETQRFYVVKDELDNPIAHIPRDRYHEYVHALRVESYLEELLYEAEQERDLWAGEHASADRVCSRMEEYIARLQDEGTDPFPPGVEEEYREADYFRMQVLYSKLRSEGYYKGLRLLQQQNDTSFSAYMDEFRVKKDDNV